MNPGLLSLVERARVSFEASRMSLVRTRVKPNEAHLLRKQKKSLTTISHCCLPYGESDWFSQPVSS